MQNYSSHMALYQDVTGTREINCIQLFMSSTINVKRSAQNSWSSVLQGCTCYPSCSTCASVLLNDNERWRGAAISAECTPRKQPLLSSVWPSCSFVIEVTFVWVFMSSRPDKIKNTYSYSLSQAALQHLRFLDFFSPFASFSMFDSSRWQLRLIISIYLQSAGSPYGRHAVMHNCTCGHPHTPAHAAGLAVCHVG